MNNIELANKIVNFLNELLQVDKEAIEVLIDRRVKVNEQLLNHPTVQVSSEDGKTGSVGLLGILNGLVGVKSNGWGYIVAHYDDESGRLINFSVNSDV